MPTRIVNEIIAELKSLRKDFTTHLIESGGIKLQLAINTWLTGVILVALLGRFIAEWFKR